MSTKDNTKTVRVSTEALQDLKDAVYERFGTLRGHLKEAASQALREKSEKIGNDEVGDDA